MEKQLGVNLKTSNQGKDYPSFSSTLYFKNPVNLISI